MQLAKVDMDDNVRFPKQVEAQDHVEMVLNMVINTKEKYKIKDL